MTPDQEHPQRLYLGKSSPDDFINAKILDWVYLVGDITTQYELDFIHRFGKALKSSTAPAPAGTEPAEQRIREAIVVLEQEKKWAVETKYGNFLDQDSYRDGIIQTCNEAISLLRGERR